MNQDAVKEEMKMVTRIYALIWLVLLALTAAVYVTGNFTEMTLTIFGFTAATLFALGLTMVLPWWVDKTHTWKYGGN